MKLLILVGIPGSGKSTFAKQFCKDNESYIRLNRDDLRLMFNPNSVYTPSLEHIVVNSQLSLLENLFKAGHDVILDNTNFSSDIFKKIELIALKYKVEISYKVMTTSLEECLKRNSLRERNVPDKVIQDMYNNFIKDKTEEDIISSIRSKSVLNIPKIPAVSYQHHRQNEFKNAIIVDIDGTIAEATHRNIFDFNKVGTDTPRTQVIKIIDAYVSYYEDINVLVLTGRKSNCQAQTIEWLNKYFPSYQMLFMRDEKDNRPDFIVKREIYLDYIKDKYNILAVFDDRNSVVDMWRNEGLNVLQVNDGDF